MNSLSLMTFPLCPWLVGIRDQRLESYVTHHAVRSFFHVVGRRHECVPVLVNFKWTSPLAHVLDRVGRPSCR